MFYSKNTLYDLSLKTHFIKDNLEKVIRLSEILKFLNSCKQTKGKLALKGGTAINLTAVELPRLSVDIDLDCAINSSKEETMEAKKQISNASFDYMVSNDYSLSSPPREHYVLSSYTFSYVNNANNKDNIKIDINFIDRCHVLPLLTKKIFTRDLLENFDVLTLDPVELYASKINALISRATPRDLYDVNKMFSEQCVTNTILLKKCLIFYNMVSGNQDIDSLSLKNIEDIDYHKIKTQLKPVIAKDDDFDLETAKKYVINNLRSMLNFTENELDFISEFKNKRYRPELLFENALVNNIKNHPMAIYRCLGKY